MKYLILILFFGFIGQQFGNAGLISPAPSPSPLPSPQAMVKAARQISAGANQLFQYDSHSLLQLAAIVWANADGLTPQQVFSALGVNQCPAHEAFLAQVALVNAQLAGTIPNEPKTVTESGSGNSCVLVVSP